MALDSRVYRPLAITACLALVGFVTFAVVSATHHGNGSFPTVSPPSALHAGERAPSFDLTRLGGDGLVSFAGHATEPVIVNFFASWCPNCVAELDAFASVSKAASSTRFLGVDSEDSAPKTAEALLHNAGISYPVGVDRSGAVANRFLISALPVTFFIAPSGEVRGEIFGTATTAELPELGGAPASKRQRMSDSQAVTEAPKELDRAAMFAAGPPRIPRRTIWIALGVAAVLGIGGAFADHSFNVEPTAPPTPVTHTATAQHETLAQFVGLKPLDDKTAPPIDLTDELGRPFSLSQVVGRPVILTFLGPTCKESCPVITLEIAEAEATLEKDHLRPALVIVNADPQHLSVAAAHAALEHPPLAELSGATFLTGTLSEMEPIWKTYEVTIEDDPTTGALAYTDVVFLLDSAGHLRDSLTPFANESFSGTATLSTPEIERFASGIASYLEQVAR